MKGVRENCSVDVMKESESQFPKEEAKGTKTSLTQKQTPLFVQTDLLHHKKTNFKMLHEIRH